MIYIERDKDGNIAGVFMRKQYKDQEMLAIADAEVTSFINRDLLPTDEKKIQVEITALNRVEAIQSLKDQGELPIDYEVEKI